MVLPQGRKGEQGAVDRTGVHGVHLDDQLFYPVEHLDGGLVVAGNLARVQQDEITTAIINIDSFHHEIHEGETFITSHYVASIANNADIILHITPGTKFDHLVFSGSCGGDALLELFEDPDVDADGVAEAEINMKRLGGAVAESVVVSDPTVNVVGTNLFECLLPGGTGGNATGGIMGLRQNSEFPLDPDKTYMTRLTNTSGNAKPGCLIIQWYEESDN
jgi:hypothetical protein